MLWAQSTIKDYIRAEHKIQSISKLFIPQVIIPQVSTSLFPQTTAQILSTISERKTRKTNTCFGAHLYSATTQHGNLYPAEWSLLFCGPTQEPVVATANTGKLGRGFGKNAGVSWATETGKGRVKTEVVVSIVITCEFSSFDSQCVCFSSNRFYPINLKVPTICQPTCRDLTHLNLVS